MKVRGYAVIVFALIPWIIILPVSSGGLTAEGKGDRVQLAFVGDVLLASRIGKLMEEKGVDFPWQQVAPVLQSADFAVANLECAVGTGGQPWPDKEWTFRAAPASLAGLAGAGIDLVGLANNHMLDYGREGLLETLANLDRAGLARMGAGRDLTEASRPHIVSLQGMKLGFLAVSLVVPRGWGAGERSPGVFSGHDTQRMLRAVRHLAEQVDWTVVFVHWGEERADHPRRWHRDLASRLLEAGADIIIGHHPHVWQGIYRRDRSLVAYSLGNFVFTTRPEFPQQQQTGILLVTLSPDRIEEVKVIPARIEWGRTVLAEGQTGQEILARLDRLSAPFQTYLTGEGRAERAPFSDTRDHWAREAIRQLAARGLVTGHGDGSFRPDEPATYAQLVTLLVRMLKLPTEGSPPSRWETPYLRAAITAGLWPAEEEASFPADEPIPRWEVARLLERYLRLAGTPLPPPASLPPYRDLGEAPRPSLEAISRVTEVGLLDGYPEGTFRPRSALTRAEMATLALRLLEKGDPGQGPGSGRR